MLETESFTTEQEKEFINGFIPGVSITVDEENVAKVFMKTWPQGLEWKQQQVTEMIALLVEVHDYMERKQEDNTMGLFDDFETEEVEEIDVSESLVNELNEIDEPNEFHENIGNAKALLYMNEDYAKERISKEEIQSALHILRDSITSYLSSSIDEDGKETKQPEQEEERITTGE